MNDSRHWWSDEDLGFLADHADWTAVQIGEALGRSAAAVRQKRNLIKRGWAPANQRWTEDEDRFIIESPHFTIAQVAKYLPGRTSDAIAKRRQVLAAVKGLEFTGMNRSPFKPSRRTLLAKTCTGCGLLLDAIWFRRNSRSGYVSKCARCAKIGRTDISGDYSDKALARRAEVQKRFQAPTTANASRRNQTWLESDFKILADADLTITEKASLLNRTYSGVAVKCSRMGYASKVGLGSPQKGRWVIDNPNADKMAG